jgi:hypothetical protein
MTFTTEQREEEKMCMRKILLGTAAALLLAIGPVLAADTKGPTVNTSGQGPSDDLALALGARSLPHREPNPQAPPMTDGGRTHCFDYSN